MPDFDDSLRTALRELADRAGPPHLAAGPLIRRAARRRARFAAASGFCAVAVAAAAVAVPVTLRAHPATTGKGLSGSPVASRPWVGDFTCGEPLPPGLPPATGDGLRIAITSVTRSASGVPAVRWSLDGPGATIGPVTAGFLIVRDGTIFAAEQARPPAANAQSLSLAVESAQVYKYAPDIIEGTSGSWDAMWRQHQAYRVIIVATVWTDRGTSPIVVPVPVRLSATAVLPPG